jgi:hypothetical protein
VFNYVDDYVAEHGPLSKKARVVELITEWFRKNDPPPPRSDRTIPTKIKSKKGVWLAAVIRTNTF